MTPIYPLSAIVGHEMLIEALLVNAVTPDVGGVLVRGDRGTAKSTAVRALAPLLPEVTVATGQSYAFAPGERSPEGVVAIDAEVEQQPAPLVELPIGTTIDRLLGSLDLGRALAGERAFEPGLLARAHQGILYVDEVNLLPDHMVDVLLDVAATGVARVEREAVSTTHDSRFLLVGTMNLEEGELRPQLLDRFGLGVEVRTSSDPGLRAEIVRRRIEFRSDPEAFVEQWREAEMRLAARIARARELLADVVLPDRQLLRITAACSKLGIDGARGDIVCAVAAQALAALDGFDQVEEEHVRRAALLALNHRRPADPLHQNGNTDDQIQQALDDPPEDDPSPEDPNNSGGGQSPDGESARMGGGPSSGDAGDPRKSPVTASAVPAGFSPSSPAREKRDKPTPAALPAGVLKLRDSGSGRQGRRAVSHGLQAGSIDSRLAAETAEDLAIVASLRASLEPSLPGAANPKLMQHIRAGREGALICLVVDTSGSMGARHRLARVKGALLSLLQDAYTHRDRVALISFRDDEAKVLVPPSVATAKAALAVESLPNGGRTPLAQGLRCAVGLIEGERRKHRHERSIVVVLTDGRTSDRDGAIRLAASRLGRIADAVHIVNTEQGLIRVGITAEIAVAAKGDVHQLDQPEIDAGHPANRRVA